MWKVIELLLIMLIITALVGVTFYAFGMLFKALLDVIKALGTDKQGEDNGQNN